MATSNYSIYAIPAFYILALAPQFYSTILINRATNGRFDNANPRGASFAETCRKSLDKGTLGRFERGKAAHINALENLPLFAAAVICANIAGLDMGMVNSVRLFLYSICLLKSLPVFVDVLQHDALFVFAIIILFKKLRHALLVCQWALTLTLGTFKICGAFLALRIAYMFLYIEVESMKLSYVRTLVFLMSVGCCITLLLKAGNVLVDGKGMRL